MDDLNVDLQFDKYFQGLSNNAYYEVTHAQNTYYKDD